MGNSATKGLPYTQGPAIGAGRFRSPFTIYEGTSTNTPSTTSAPIPSSSSSSTGNNDKVLLFRYDKRTNNTNNSWANNADTALAQNALKRLRMLRHPNVLKFIVSIYNNDYDHDERTLQNRKNKFG